jgi:hypothetical protein
MKYVIWQRIGGRTKVNGFQTKVQLEMLGWRHLGYLVESVAEFEAESSAEARGKFDAWDDAQPRPEERCPVCDALRAEDHTIPVVDTSSGTMSSTVEPATNPS